MVAFEDRIDTIQQEIARRRYKWTLSTMSYDDVSQIIWIRVHENYASYRRRKGSLYPLAKYSDF